MVNNLTSSLKFEFVDPKHTALLVIDPQYDLVIVYLTNQKHSPVKEGRRRLYFEGDRFRASRFGRIVTRVYEAFLDVETAPDDR